MPWWDGVGVGVWEEKNVSEIDKSISNFDLLKELYEHFSDMIF